MKLAETLRIMAPLLAGKVAPEAAAAALGVPAPGVALYARLARAARASLLEGMYPHCRRSIVRLFDDARWDAIVSAYFDAHPERRFVRHANAAAFVPFLAGTPGLPPWLGELADLEWREWKAEIAPRVPEDDAPDDGALRVTSTLELRTYRHDLVAWLDEAGGEGAPAARTTVCAFWQDREALSFRNALDERQVAALEALRSGESVEPDVLAELRGADIVLGAC